VSEYVIVLSDSLCLIDGAEKLQFLKEDLPLYEADGSVLFEEYTFRYPGDEKMLDVCLKLVNMGVRGEFVIQSDGLEGPVFERYKLLDGAIHKHHGYVEWNASRIIELEEVEDDAY